MNYEFILQYLDKDHDIEGEANQIVQFMMKNPRDYITIDFLRMMSTLNLRLSKSLIYDSYTNNAKEMCHILSIPWYVRRYPKHKTIELLKTIDILRSQFPSVEYQMADQMFKKGNYDEASNCLMIAAYVMGDKKAKQLYTTLSKTKKNSFHIGEDM